LYALWRDADGRHKKRLGLAHVKDSGWRTPRGAIVWRAADGPKPDATYLSPAEAGEELNRLLASAPRERTDPRHSRDQDRTFAEACDAWLGYVEHEKALRRSRGLIGKGFSPSKRERGRTQEQHDRADDRSQRRRAVHGGVR
jgi:hypothetical protein